MIKYILHNVVSCQLLLLHYSTYSSIYDYIKHCLYIYEYAVHLLFWIIKNIPQFTINQVQHTRKNKGQNYTF